MKADSKIISMSPSGRWSTEIEDYRNGRFLINSYQRKDDGSLDNWLISFLIVTKEDVQAMMDYINSKGVK